MHCDKNGIQGGLGNRKYRWFNLVNKINQTNPRFNVFLCINRSENIRRQFGTTCIIIYGVYNAECHFLIHESKITTNSKIYCKTHYYILKIHSRLMMRNKKITSREAKRIFNFLSGTNYYCFENGMSIVLSICFLKFLHPILAQ